MNTVDLSKLPLPNVLKNLDFEALLAARKTKFIGSYETAEERQEMASRLSLDSDPINKLLQESTYRELLIRANYNEEARALLIAYASGTDLDHLGITYYQKEQRLLVQKGDPKTFPPTLEVWETDANYRKRLLLKPFSYSVAGPTNAYIFHAQSASGKIKSIGATSPAPCQILISVLSIEGDGTPTSEILSAVETQLKKEYVRPLTDQLTIKPALIKPYSLSIDLVLYAGPDANLVKKTAENHLTKLANEQHVCKGHIMQSAIDAAAHQAGVKRVIINAPAENIECTDHEAPYCTEIKVNILRIEN